MGPLVASISQVVIAHACIVVTMHAPPVAMHMRAAQRLSLPCRRDGSHIAQRSSLPCHTALVAYLLPHVTQAAQVAIHSARRLFVAMRHACSASRYTRVAQHSSLPCHITLNAHSLLHCVLHASPVATHVDRALRSHVMCHACIANRCTSVPARCRSCCSAPR